MGLIRTNYRLSCESLAPNMSMHCCAELGGIVEDGLIHTNMTATFNGEGGPCCPNSACNLTNAAQFQPLDADGVSQRAYQQWRNCTDAWQATHGELPTNLTNLNGCSHGYSEVAAAGRRAPLQNSRWAAIALALLLFAHTALADIQCRLSSLELTRACCTRLNGTLLETEEPLDKMDGSYSGNGTVVVTHGTWCDLTRFEEAAGEVGRGRGEATAAWYGCLDAGGTGVGVGCKSESATSNAPRRAPLSFAWVSVWALVLAVLLVAPTALADIHCFHPTPELTRACCDGADGITVSDNTNGALNEETDQWRVEEDTA